MEFNPLWLVCIDESMVAFHNTHAPKWISLNINPHLFGNDHYEIACCEKKLVFSMELVEGKNKPKEGMHDAPEFKEEKG